MQKLESFWQNMQASHFLSNSLADYLSAVAIFIAVLVALKLFQLIILSRLRKFARKTKTDFDDALVEIFLKIKPPFYFFVALYFSFRTLSLTPLVEKIISVIILLVIVFEIVMAAERFVEYFIKKYLGEVKDGKDQKKYSQSMLSAASIIVKIGLWIIAIVLILSNLGVNVTSLIASLGIGGIAIALALQNVLSDLFSAFSIYIDKPFEVGDFITVGQDSGTVEKIGLKTTRIRSLQGEEIVVSNRELTTARVQNFKKLQRRRVVSQLNVAYESTQTQLKEIPKTCQEIIEKITKAEFDRCHFTDYGESSLNFELVYYVNSAEYVDFMDVKQKVNFEILSKFRKLEINFAYPTQTIYVNNESKGGRA